MNNIKKFAKHTRQIAQLAGKSIDMMPVFSDLAKFSNYAVCGGVAVALNGRIRATEDIDILIASETALERLALQYADKFRQIRPHAFQHRQTGVEVDVLTPEHIKVPNGIVESAIDSAGSNYGIRVVNKTYLIILKMFSGRRQDYVDVVSLLADKSNADIDFIEETIPADKVELFKELVKESETADDLMG
jgi:hypothetical protein